MLPAVSQMFKTKQNKQVALIQNIIWKQMVFNEVKQ